MKDLGSPCPDDDTLAQWLEGGLSSSARGEVDAHLETCAECRAVVGDDDPIGDGRGGGVPGADDRAPPDRLGRFVVLGRVGRGGMGEVLEAYDPRLDRKVALKIVRRADGAVAEALRVRLAREARAMARLRHPNVVNVFEVDERDGQVFVVMELVAGPTLGAWLAAEERPWRAVLTAFLQAGEGLAAAHEVGIVHRDFKPDNALVDADGSVRVTDFGLARIDDADDRGAVMGTPAFMAPEQAAGQPVDARADVYSWSLALERALFGEVRAPPTDLPEARLLVASTMPTPSMSPRRGASPPAWVKRALARGLVADPDARWPSMRAALAALGRDPRRRVGWALAAALVGISTAVGAIVTAGPSERDRCSVAATELERVWDAGRRAQTREAFLATGAPFAESAARGVEQALDRWADAWTAMRREACEATHVRGVQSGELLDRRMACLDRRRAEMAALVALFVEADRTLVERAVSSIQNLEPVATCADRAALLQPIAPPRPDQIAMVRAAHECLDTSRALGAAGRYRDALEVVMRCADAASAIGYAPLDAELTVEIGRGRGWTGDLIAAVDALYQGVWSADTAHDDALRVRASIELAIVLGNRLGRFEEARRVIDHARAALTRMGGDDRIESRLVNARGQIAYKEGRYAEAEAEYRRALALERDTSSAHAIAVRNNLANAFFRRGRLDEAVALHQEVLLLRATLLGASHPNVATTHNNLGIAYLALGRYDAARDALALALDIDRATSGPTHPRLVATLSNLGIALVGVGEVVAALDHFERALAIAVGAFGPEHADIGAILAERALAFLAVDAMAEARSDADRALAIQAAAQGLEHAMVARTREVRARIALAERRLDDALIELDAAIRIEERSAGLDSVTLAPLLALVGETLLAAGDIAAAIPPLERARALPPGGDPVGRSDATFALARALVDTFGPSKEPLDLAAEARSILPSNEASTQARRAAIDLWLAALD